MKLSNEWFTALSSTDDGKLIFVNGRDELTEFLQCGKLKERVEITWPYEGDAQGMPSDAVVKWLKRVFSNSALW